MSNMLKQMLKIASDNSPTLLMSGAAGGLITTVVLAIKATPKCVDILNKATKESKEPLTKKDVVKLCWKEYIPTVVVGGASIALMIASTKTQFRRTAAVASAFALTEKAFTEYKDEVSKALGDRKEREIRDNTDATSVKSHPAGINEIILTGKGESLCYDKLTDRYFKSDYEKIKQAIAELNVLLYKDGFVTLTDAYDLLGLAPTTLSDMLGWDSDNGKIDVFFSSQLTQNNAPCLVITFSVFPKHIR